MVGPAKPRKNPKRDHSLGIGPNRQTMTILILRRPARRLGWIFAVSALALLFAGCGDKGAPQGRPPVDVTVLAVQPQDSPIVYEFVGQTQSSREVEIRARVDGFLEKRVYTEGGLVRTGQPMFHVDRKPFEARLQSAKGELAQQQAALDVANANLTRIKPLAEQNR